MTEAPQFIMIDGRPFKRVDTIATGQVQLLRLESVKCYIVVHPNGRQAWVHDNQINEIVRQNAGKFRYTSNALNDLKRLIKLGLKPFHVDPDFDPTALDIGSVN